MRAHPFLNPVEAAIVRWLMKSPLIGLVCIKEHGSSLTWVLTDESDPAGYGKQMDVSDDVEPDSMKLERIYHAPDAEK